MLGSGRLGRLKRALRITKDQLCSLKHDEHIWMVVVPGIDKLQRDGNQIRILAVEMRPDEDSGMSCISSWQFYDLNTTLQIERKEMTGMSHIITMANHRINLKGARVAIVQIRPQDEHDESKRTLKLKASRHREEGSPPKV